MTENVSCFFSGNLPTTEVWSLLLIALELGTQNSRRCPPVNSKILAILKTQIFVVHKATQKKGLKFMSIIKLIINLKKGRKNVDKKQGQDQNNTRNTRRRVLLLLMPLNSDRIFQKDLKNVDQFRSCFLQVLFFDDSNSRNGILLSEEAAAVLMSLGASMRDLTLIWVPVTIVGLFLELSSRSRDPCHLFPSSECLKAYNFLRLLVWVANWIQFTPIRKLAFLAIMQYMKRALAFLSVTMMKHLKKRPPKSLSHGLEK